jgi:hypothetical protein
MATEIGYPEIDAAFTSNPDFMRVEDWTEWPNIANAEAFRYLLRRRGIRDERDKRESVVSEALFALFVTRRSVAAMVEFAEVLVNENIELARRVISRAYNAPDLRVTYAFYEAAPELFLSRIVAYDDVPELRAKPDGEPVLTGFLDARSLMTMLYLGDGIWQAMYGFAGSDDRDVAYDNAVAVWSQPFNVVYILRRMLAACATPSEIAETFCGDMYVFIPDDLLQPYLDLGDRIYNLKRYLLSTCRWSDNRSAFIGRVAGMVLHKHGETASGGGGDGSKRLRFHKGGRRYSITWANQARQDITMHRHSQTVQEDVQRRYGGRIRRARFVAPNTVHVLL